jgi:RNA polymerase sigma factor (sigma-70 family)
LQTPHDFFNLAATQMRRELIDLSRRCARRNERAGFGSLAMDESADAPRLEPADHTFSPERLSLWTEFHEQVGRLPEAECEVFTHVWYHDLPYVEAAALLGCDERTVRRRYQSARRMLFERLGGQLPF